MQRLKNRAIRARFPLHVLIARADPDLTTPRSCAEMSRFIETKFLSRKHRTAGDHSCAVAFEEVIAGDPNLGNVGVAWISLHGYHFR